MTIRGMMSKRLAVIAAAALLAALAGVALYLAVGTGQSKKSQALERFIAYMNSPRITYIKVGKETETWIDPQKDRAKEVAYDEKGEIDQIELHVRRRGWFYAPWNRELTSSIVEKDAEPLFWEAILGAAERGELTEEATESLKGNGRVVWYSFDLRSDERGDEEGEEQRGHEEVALDSVTGIPKRTRIVTPEESSEAAIVEVTQLPQSKGRKIFRLPRNVRTRESLRQLTVKELRKLPEYRPVWLGKKVGGATLGGINALRRNGQLQWVALFYRNKIVIHQWPLDSLHGRDAWTISRYVQKTRLSTGDPGKIQRYPGSPVRLVVTHKGIVVRIDGEGGQSAKELIDIAERYLRRV